MGCSGGAERGAVTCGCSGQTVFKGAVIGQVFTGDVQLQCPLAERHRAQREEPRGATVETGRPLSTALIAVAIWQATYPAPVVEAICGSSLSHAAMFMVAGCVTRYLKPKVLRWIRRRAARSSSAKKWRRDRRR